MYGRTPEAADYRQHVTLEAIQQEVGPCREWPHGEIERCNKPAEYVLWGKLLPAEALGPRCYDCAAKHVGHRALGDSSWAIVDLGLLARRIDEAHAHRDKQKTGGDS